MKMAKLNRIQQARMRKKTRRQSTRYTSGLYCESRSQMSLENKAQVEKK